MVRRANIQQYAFTAGILGDDMLARQDIKQYYAGARDLTNVIALPQGGVTKRAGLSFVDMVNDADKGVMMTRFEFADQQSYLVIFTHLKIHIYYQDQLQISLSSSYGGDDLAKIDWTQSLDTMIITHPDIHPKRLMRQGAHNQWILENIPLTNIPQYDFGSGNENVWSNNRGYPRSVYFFEGRLYFGGSRSRPQTLWGSRTGDFFNFAVSADNILDDDSISLTLDGERVNAIEKLYAHGDLLVFTNGGLFALMNTPVTPENFFLRRHNEQEAAAIKPVIVDNAVHYVSAPLNHAKQAILSVNYDETQQIYISQDITKLAGNIVHQPIDMAAQNADQNMVANHLYVVNKNGTIAVLNSLKAEKILGWTKIITNGDFIKIARVEADIYVIVKRKFNNITHYCLEKFNYDAVFDHNIGISSAQATTTFNDSKLQNYNDIDVHIYGDGAYMGTKKIKNNTVTIDYAVKNIHVGFNYQWNIQTMPLEAVLTDGTFVGNRHRLTKATIQMQQTNGLNVNGRAIDLRLLDQPILDNKPPSYTGGKTVRFIGWKGGNLQERADVKISGDAFQQATILSITTEVVQ